ncbi:hypothetical protein CBR_g16154 [Chara braunii]|uniref:DUF659 domain-containing protein n=1 Tax=Chara braunii TaxID=69332 RepID=A0A388KTW8_CHABU|nr:hypothetical protein CBR_g16154 [Chara braunii]|eukprot:GBG73438.1 hypothetical protein CBR_g16154 [Chara braunii]
MPPDLLDRVQRALEEKNSDVDEDAAMGGVAEGDGGGAEIGVDSEEPARGRPGSGPGELASGYMKNPRQEDIDDSCCEFFVENTIPFNVAKSKSFKKFKLACYGPQPAARCPLLPTGYNPLRCRLLERLCGRLEKEEQAIRDDWQVTCCTFITDGTTDICGRSLMNYILARRSKPIFVKCEDVSEGDKDAVVVVVGWKRFFRELGLEKITAICIDSFAGNKSAARMLREDPEFSQIYWIPCTAHCMDLLMHDICNKEWAAESIVRYAPLIVEERDVVLADVGKRTDMLLSPIHVVARLLDPQLRDVAVFNNVDLVAQFDSIVERLIGKKGSKRGDDGPTIVRGWLGLEKDWADEDLEGDMANVTDAVNDSEVGVQGTGSVAGSTNIAHDPPTRSASVQRLEGVEETIEMDKAEDDMDDDLSDEDDILGEKWVDERSDSDRSWTRREEILPYEEDRQEEEHPQEEYQQQEEHQQQEEDRHTEHPHEEHQQQQEHQQQEEHRGEGELEGEQCQADGEAEGEQRQAEPKGEQQQTEPEGEERHQ